MESTTTIREQVETHRDMFASRYEQHVRHTFTALVSEFGPSLKGIHNSRRRPAFEAIRRCVRSGDPYAATSRPGDPYYIDESRLTLAAVEYANQTVEAWVARIESKLGDVDEVQMLVFYGDSFDLNGKKGDAIIHIEQRRILNVSSKGLLFNQWPARIYVDGKLTSEAKYRKLFA